MGIKDDLDLVDDQYQWLGSLFYFGSLTLEYIHTMDVSDTVLQLGDSKLLIAPRLSGMGIPDKPPAAAIAIG